MRLTPELYRPRRRSPSLNLFLRLRISPESLYKRVRRQRPHKSASPKRRNHNHEGHEGRRSALSKSWHILKPIGFPSWTLVSFVVYGFEEAITSVGRFGSLPVFLRGPSCPLWFMGLKKR